MKWNTLLTGLLTAISLLGVDNGLVKRSETRNDSIIYALVGLHWVLSQFPCCREIVLSSLAHHFNY